MVETKYICDLCKSSYKENAERYILALDLNMPALMQPYEPAVFHVCLNCLRGLQKALKANWVQKLLGSSQNALDAVVWGDRESLPKHIEAPEIWQTWQNDSDRIRWARSPEYVHLWNDTKHTINSLSKAYEEFEQDSRNCMNINDFWFRKVHDKLNEYK